MSYLQRRGAMYRFRRYVPPRLRPIIEKHEIVRSLKTKDAAEAQRWGIAVSAEVDRLFAEAEAALSNPAVRVYKSLHEDAEDRLRRPKSDDQNEAESSVSDVKEEAGCPYIHIRGGDQVCA